MRRSLGAGCTRPAYLHEVPHWLRQNRALPCNGKPSSYELMKRENAKEASLRPLICAVCFSTLTERIAAQRRHVDGAGHVHHRGLSDDVLRECITYRFRFTIRLEGNPFREERPPSAVERGDQDAHVVGAKDPDRVLIDGA